MNSPGMGPISKASKPSSSHVLHMQAEEKFSCLHNAYIRWRRSFDDASGYTEGCVC